MCSPTPPDVDVPLDDEEAAATPTFNDSYLSKMAQYILLQMALQRRISTGQMAARYASVRACVCAHVYACVCVCAYVFARVYACGRARVCVCVCGGGGRFLHGDRRNTCHED